MDRDTLLATLRDIAAAFDAHDLDRIMGHFADDAVFDSPRGPDRHGTRYEGTATEYNVPTSSSHAEISPPSNA